MIRVACIMFILLCTPSAWAQEQDNGAAPASATEDADAPAPRPEKAAPAPESETENAPSDYRSSEQISEDRSVSFPVDI